MHSPLPRLPLAALALSITLALAACSSAPLAESAGAPAAAKAPPKLVVFLVVDGLPMRQVLAYREQLQADGFKRFLDQGAWFSDARYAHGHTVTAAGPRHHADRCLPAAHRHHQQ